MLKINLNGKVVTTANDKQSLLINDIPIDIERIGNAIYVNKTAINLVITEPAKRKSYVGIGFVVVAALGGSYLGITNSTIITTTAVEVIELISPFITTAFAWVTQLI